MTDPEKVAELFPARDEPMLTWKDIEPAIEPAFTIVGRWPNLTIVPATTTDECTGCHHSLDLHFKSVTGVVVCLAVTQSVEGQAPHLCPCRNFTGGV